MKKIFFNKIHSCEWNIEHILSLVLELTKFMNVFIIIHLNLNLDLVFYDAFSPRIQPKLWEEDILKSLIN